MKASLAQPEIREVMDIRQAAHYLGISADSLYRYAATGFIPAFRLGNRWRFRKSRLDEWMDRRSGLEGSACTKTGAFTEEARPFHAGSGTRGSHRLLARPLGIGLRRSLPHPWVKASLPVIVSSYSLVLAPGLAWSTALPRGSGFTVTGCV